MDYVWGLVEMGFISPRPKVTGATLPVIIIVGRGIYFVRWRPDRQPVSCFTQQRPPSPIRLSLSSFPPATIPPISHLDFLPAHRLGRLAAPVVHFRSLYLRKWSQYKI